MSRVTRLQIIPSWAALLQIQVSASTQPLLAGQNFGAGTSAPLGRSRGGMGQLGFSLFGHLALFPRGALLSALQRADN